MKGIRIILGLVAIATAVSVGAATAQDPDRREMERRLRELREEMRRIERELGDRDLVVTGFPRVLAFSANRAQLGVYVQMRADEDTDPVGAVLSGVEPDSPADAAGLEEGDIIISLDGEPLAGRYPAAARDESEPAKKLVDLVGDMNPGDEVTIEYRRGNETFTTTATLEDRTEDLTFGHVSPGAAVMLDRLRAPEGRARVQVRSFGPEGNVLAILSEGLWSDIELVALNEDLGRYFGTSEGLLVITAPDREGVDLQAGDVILSIDGREPRTPSRALRILHSYGEGETAAIVIMRDRSRMTVNVAIPERGVRDPDSPAIWRRR